MATVNSAVTNILQSIFFCVMFKYANEALSKEACSHHRIKTIVKLKSSNYCWIQPRIQVDKSELWDISSELQ